MVTSKVVVVAEIPSESGNMPVSYTHLGITKGLSQQGDVETTFCMPKPTGEEEKFLNIIGMNQVPICLLYTSRRIDRA